MRANLATVILLFLIGCAQENPETNKISEQPETPFVIPPEFNSDSAYSYIQKQVNFGPRVPNTQPHKECRDYLIKKLQSYGLKVTVQNGVANAFDGTKLNFTNIIAAYKPEEKSRILLCAHWDTRPFADQDKNQPNMPILGANDGGSGVGVLLEIARLLQTGELNKGIDIILFDAEDYGKSQVKDSYCLGSQYWSMNKHIKNYQPKFGILLDMVGAKNATFTMEGYSMMYAPHVVKNVWKSAAQIGYSDYFLFKRTSPMIDDHYYLNQIGEIPCIDIIQHDPSTITGFGAFWHTHDDNMTIISKATLKAVGQTVLQTIYSQ